MTAHFLNYREIGRRIAIHGLLDLASPCHLGGADANASSDQPLLRTSEGRPYLTGTTLTGLLRNTLHQADPTATTALFGASWDDPQGKQARLMISDASIESSGPVPTELRDGVCIDPRSGVAEDKKKYDVELLPAGTRFGLRFELVLCGERDKDTVLLRGLLGLLHALEQGRIKLGARTRRGFGETEVVSDPAGCRWQVEEYLVTTEEGLYAWLGRGLYDLPDDWPRAQAVRWQDAAALARHWDVALPAVAAPAAFEVRLDLMQEGSLLVGSEGQSPEEPDRSHLRRLHQGAGDPLEPVLPATSLAGVLRHRCLRIAQTLADQREGKPCELVEWMFGPAEIRKDGPAWASRVGIKEARILGGRSLRHTRVRIDPWTGGAVEGLLFTEDAHYGGRVAIDISLRETDPEETHGAPARALLLLALRDLASGDLSVGGEGGVGRGRWRPMEGRPFATVAEPPVELYLEPDGTVRCEPPDVFEQDFAALQRHLTS